MSKLYPPQVEGTLPAVAKGNALIVPFQLNRAVSQNDFTQLSIIVKTVQTNTMLSDGEVKLNDLPNITDVNNMIEILIKLGVKVKKNEKSIDL